MQSTGKPWTRVHPAPGGAIVQLLWLVLLVVSCCIIPAHGMTDDAIRNLRQETRDIFYHGFDNYMKHAFPEDELRPLSCAPLTRDRANPAHIEVNDVLGNYSLTLIDSLSTLAILASSPPSKKGRNKALEDFHNGVASLVEYYGDGTEGPLGQGKRARGFDLDSKVQVFETVIRGVGGLVSAHQFAVGDLPIRGYEPKLRKEGGRTGILWKNGLLYDGQLLRLATDLAERLLPAFKTPTGLPYPRVNLRQGVPFYANSPYNTDAEYGQCSKTPPKDPEITETCSAGAGSLVLEFATLSRLTGDARFERAAKDAFWAVWNRRSSVGLIGAGIDAETGQWVSPYTGIGAGIDSFFEYTLKTHILLSGLPYDPARADTDSPSAFLKVWEEAHAGIKRHVYRGATHQSPHYIQVDLYTGALRAFWIDSLSAFYQGLLALAGELDEAIETHLLYTALWTRYSAMPERWSTASGTIENGIRWWGGRPEFIESTWYLYRATQDPWYLHVGEMALRDIKRRCWTKCGWAGLQDVRSGEQSDRMESFFLGETAKYLYLLFDPSHPLNTWDAPFVFTTEGHPLVIPKRLRPSSSTILTEADSHEGHSTPETCALPPAPLPFSISATAARSDIFHAASLARLHLMPTLENIDSPLTEFNADHPSISISDIRSPSNYTYYPWTLPPGLIPHNATSSKMATRSTFDLSFPNLPNTLSVGALQRVTEGVLVNSMSGLRLGMIREPEGLYTSPDEEFRVDERFRIYAISNIALGRDEQVFMSRETIENFNPIDPFFTRTRDPSTVDLMIDAAPATTESQATTLSDLLANSLDKENASIIDIDLDTLKDLNLELDTSDLPLSDLTDQLPSSLAPDGSDSTAADEGSYLSSLLASIQSLLSAPSATSSPKPPSIQRHAVPASLPSGPGAAPLPDTTDPSLTHSSSNPLPWSTIYIAPTTLCDERLPITIPREYQVLVIKRGDCSFSSKLRNIPAYAPKGSSLQLVVIVSYPEHEEVFDPRAEDFPPTSPNPEEEAGQYDPERPSMRSARRQARDPRAKDGGPVMRELVQPLLDESQRTPSGLPRPNPIPVVMVSGGDEIVEVLRRARGVGVRRRYYFLSQGVRIGNLIVL